MDETCCCIIGGPGSPGTCGKPKAGETTTNGGRRIVLCARHWWDLQTGNPIEVLAQGPGAAAEEGPTDE